ncbi:MAG: HlyC/CorC family transporter [Euzebyales bacterium]|nr:HlyC/CorC family transporter [Euzebyales bacterium]
MSLTALAIAIVLLALNGFFVAAEFALLASRRSKLEQLAAEGSKAAASAARGLKELSLMLAGAQLGITMASFGLGAIAEPAVAAGIEAALSGVAITDAIRHAIAFTIALSIVVFLHMVVGEMAPKSWAITHPEGSALLLARPFRAFTLVFRPFIQLLNALANGVVRLCGVEPQDERAMVHNAGDLVLLLNESHLRGHLPDQQRELLHRALELSGLDAESAMVPRRDIVAVSVDADVEALERIASETGRSRLPVYEGELDQIRGMLHVKDLLGVDGPDRASTTAATLARPALVTPESRLVEDLMVEMREQRQHVALVVDEYGTVTGLVALEDLLEELIGDFEDESDRGPRATGTSEDGTFTVPASLRPDELRAELDVDLPHGEWETIAGYVIHALGRLPQVGDCVTVDSAQLCVARMDGHRVADVTVRRT